MNAKEYKTNDELILLLEKRGMDFSNGKLRSKAKNYLQRIGYYRLVNGYAPLFYIKGQKDFFKPGTTIDEIYAVYQFDSRIRALIIEQVLPFETHVKALVVDAFSQNHKGTNYLAYDNFDTSRKDAYKNITSLLSGIQKQIADRSSDPSIVHYLTNYGYIPFWVLNTILTLGTISKFYSLMKQPERQIIAKAFKLQDSELESVLTYISSVRNLCAHGNRLYCFRSKRPLPDLDFHNKIAIPRGNNGEYSYGKRDLFAAMIALKMVSPSKAYNAFVGGVSQALNELNAKLTTITSDEVLDVMGFPKDWKKMLKTPKENA